MRGTDGIQLSNASADSAAAVLQGGTYALMATATWGGGNVQVQVLAFDSSTWISVGTSLTADGMNTLSLPPCQAKLKVTTATGVYATLTRIPGE